MNWQLTRIASFALLAVLVAPVLAEERLKARNVQNALHSLEESQAYLTQAVSRMGESRRARDGQDDVARASDDISEALNHVRRMLQAKEERRTIDEGQATRSERPLQQASRSLEEATTYLSEAEGNFEGHRKEALQLVQSAHKRIENLAQNEMAMYEDQYDRRSRDSYDDRDRVDRDRNDRSRTARDGSLPRDVRRAIDREVPDLEINEIKREGEGNNALTYKVEGYSPRDGKVEMHITEDGEILKMERKDRKERGRD